MISQSYWTSILNMLKLPLLILLLSVPEAFAKEQRVVVMQIQIVHICSEIAICNIHIIYFCWQPQVYSFIPEQ
jgi:hypothetical protein